MTQVKTIEQLKGMIENAVHDFFILLNFGARSSKFVDYSPKTGRFSIVNEIDGSEQNLTEEQLMDEEYTNIGKAITAGAFYAYE